MIPGDHIWVSITTDIKQKVVIEKLSLLWLPYLKPALKEAGKIIKVFLEKLVLTALTVSVIIIIIFLLTTSLPQITDYNGMFTAH